MNEIQSLLLGLVQGLTEYLPVSSSGHLAILSHFFGLDGESSLMFTIVVHVATVLSTLVILRKEIWALLVGIFDTKTPLWNAERRYAAAIVVSMILMAIFLVLEMLVPSVLGLNNIPVEMPESVTSYDAYMAAVEQMNERYGEGTVEAVVSDQYYNMKEKIDPEMHVIDLVLKAMQETDVAPKVKPIRGGTDGAQLSFKGLPCPNIFAGGVNFHGPYEFVSIQSMQKAMDVIAKICELTANYND